MCVYVYVCVCNIMLDGVLRMYVRMCVLIRVCVSVCVLVHMCVLLMLIILIIV